MTCRAIVSSYVPLALAVVLLAGCSGNARPGGDGSADRGVGPPASEYLLESEPRGAVEVVEARETAKDGNAVILIGRIGGGPAPFVDGVAAFSLVDRSLEPCPADEGCPTPWDYCCDLNKLRSHKATVKVVDGGGQVVQADARELLGLRELATVVVRGKAQRDEAGNLAVLADGVYLRPSGEAKNP